ncbi:MAG: cation diffusion facilitator family transporter [Acidiferrobacteraceae bacterium]|jgi:cobalt-zinc-cadmium efflux system protein
MAHDHSHAGHAHHHGAGAPQRVLWIALVLTLGFAAIEAIAGKLSGSLALLGDAGHMVSDAVALGLAAVAAWIARRPPSRVHSYGLGRTEVLAALANGVIMLLVVAGIVIEAIERFRTPQPVQGVTVAAVAFAGLVLNIAVALVLSRGDRNLNTRAALLHVMGDLLGSIAALVAGGVIALTGWTPIDPILSIFICVLIVVSSVRLVREALHVIMEGVPPHLDLAEVGRAMAEADPLVRSVHDLHIWTLSGGTIALSAHLVVSDLGAWDRLLQAQQHMLRDRFGIDHVTLQPESGVHVVRLVQEPSAKHGSGGN